MCASRSALLLALVANSAQAEALVRDVASERRERVTCSIAAALKFGVPANIVLAIAEIEGGRPGQRVRNRNGSFDVGPMQFNTRYLETLERRYGITAADVAAAGCYPYELAAWRLRKHLEFDAGDAWTRAANYHSREPSENEKYRSGSARRRQAGHDGSLSDSQPTPWTGRPPIATDAKREGNTRVDMRQTSCCSGRQPGATSEIERNSRACLRQSTTASRVAGRAEPKHGRLARSHDRCARRRRAAAQAPWLQVDRRVACLGHIADHWRARRGFDEIVATDPAAPRVEVHDLSLRLGGRMHGHKSHQTGRDVDITYYQRGNRGTCVGRRVSPGELDALREWRLLRHWLERGQAEFIFVDYALQRPLYEVAKASGATEHQLAEWFQYPRGPEVRAGIIRHVPNHANHVHVRFRCSSRDVSCMRRSRPFEPKLADEPAAELMELLAE